MPVVLVVDDSAANRELIRLFLATIDCDVMLAEDGPSALALIEASPPTSSCLTCGCRGWMGTKCAGASRRCLAVAFCRS